MVKLCIGALRCAGGKVLVEHGEECADKWLLRGHVRGNRVFVGGMGRLIEKEPWFSLLSYPAFTIGNITLPINHIKQHRSE